MQRLLAVVQPLNLVLQPIQPAQWLQERVSAFADKAAARNVRIEADTHASDATGSLPTLLVDPTHLARAVDNLLDNAVRYARSAVRVAFEAHPAGALLLVDDDGPGVSDNVRDQLFEPFATGRRDGTGLGLAMAREVALAHGGDLRYIPQTTGARFELSLPWPTT